MLVSYRQNDQCAMNLEPELRRPIVVRQKLAHSATAKLSGFGWFHFIGLEGRILIENNQGYKRAQAGEKLGVWARKHPTTPLTIFA